MLITRMRHAGVALCLLALAPVVLVAQQGTLAMGIRQDATIPVPYLGPATAGNALVTDQLFLRLTGLGTSGVTVGDDVMVPELARRWFRQDSLTVDFELDPRARWHDGTPVTARDVVFGWESLRKPVLGVTQAPFALIRSVEALDTRTVRFRFHRRSGEQVYVAGFLVQPLPAHLLARVPTDSLTTSEFVRAPIGNGPYRFVRREPGQFVELRADSTFFLGKPGISRLVFRLVPASDAQVNLILSGELDVMTDAPASALPQLTRSSTHRIVHSPGSFITYLLFNSRSPSDSGLPHPILTDPRVREALTLALDRNRIAATSFGPGAETPRSLRSQAWYWLGGGKDDGRANRSRAMMLLREAGWRDSDGDGILDRDGKQLALTVIYPVQSPLFAGIGVQVEQMWRALGVAVQLEPIDGPVWLQQRRAGRFDVDIAGAEQDPSPSSLSQSWSCASASAAGSSNVGRWCDPEFDRLRDAAPASEDPIAVFRTALDRMADWGPMIPFAPTNRVVVHRRYDNVTVRASRAWTALWRWQIRPGAALPRDR